MFSVTLDDFLLYTMGRISFQFPMQSLTLSNNSLFLKSIPEEKLHCLNNMMILTTELLQTPVTITLGSFTVMWKYDISPKLSHQLYGTHDVQSVKRSTNKSRPLFIQQQNRDTQTGYCIKHTIEHILCGWTPKEQNPPTLSLIQDGRAQVKHWQHKSHIHKKRSSCSEHRCTTFPTKEQDEGVGKGNEVNARGCVHTSEMDNYQNVCTTDPFCVILINLKKIPETCNHKLSNHNVLCNCVSPQDV